MFHPPHLCWYKNNPSVLPVHHSALSRNIQELLLKGTMFRWLQREAYLLCTFCWLLHWHSHFLQMCRRGILWICLSPEKPFFTKMTLMIITCTWPRRGSRKLEIIIWTHRWCPDQTKSFSTPALPSDRFLSLLSDCLVHLELAQRAASDRDTFSHMWWPRKRLPLLPPSQLRDDDYQPVRWCCGMHFSRVDILFLMGF